MASYSVNFWSTYTVYCWTLWIGSNTKVVLELLREEQTLNEVATKYQLNPQMVSQWKSDFVKNASAVFERNKDEAGKLKKEMEEKERRYQQIIGQQSYEIDWLKKKSGLK